MKNKLLSTVSCVSFLICLETQNIQAMDVDKDFKEGYYTIENRRFPKKGVQQNGLLGVAQGKSRAGDDENYFKDNEASPSGQHAQILVDNFDYHDYLVDATKRKEVLWYIKPEDNGYIIQNVAYHTKGSFSGCLSRSDSKTSRSGFYVEVLKEGSYEERQNHYLRTGAQRNNILWNIVKAEDNTYKIQNLSLKDDTKGHYDQGWLDFTYYQSSNGHYVQALHSCAHPERYFIDKDTGAKGRWRDGILWEFSPVGKEESDSLKRVSGGISLK